MHVGSPPVTFLEVILQTSVYHAAGHREPICMSNAYKADHKQEERQTLLLERIIKNVDLLNEALLEMNRSFADINNHNQDITIVAEMSTTEMWTSICRTWSRTITPLTTMLCDAKRITRMNIKMTNPRMGISHYVCV